MQGSDFMLWQGQVKEDAVASPLHIIPIGGRRAMTRDPLATSILL
jgi:hypothetical protein